MNNGAGEKPKHITKLMISKPYSFSEFIKKGGELTDDTIPGKTEKAPNTEWPNTNTFKPAEHSTLEQPASKMIDEQNSSFGKGASATKLSTNPDADRKQYQRGPTIKNCDHTLVKGSDGKFYCDTCKLMWTNVPQPKK